MPNSAPSFFSLCLVTDFGEHTLASYLSFLDDAIAGGITSVQLRMKGSNPITHSHWIHPITKHLKAHCIPLIINDSIAMAKALSADGVHLGQTDQTPQQARSLLGTNASIGLSIESLDELQKANQMPAITYIAASAVFKSHSKTDCKMLWGIHGLKRIAARTHHPIVAIGNINLTNAESVIEAGADGIAVIRALHQAKNVYNTAKELFACVQGARS